MNREKFPILKNITYLDSASSTLKPKEVVTAITDFYLNFPLSPHSLDSKIGVYLHNLILETRKSVANLISALKNEIIFTSGATDSLNKLAQMFKIFIKKNDEILLSEYNHSSNIIPWLEIAKEVGAKIIYSINLYDDINVKTKIIAYSQINNTIAQYFDFKKLYLKAQKHNAFLINDASQAISHSKVSLLQADVIVFSGNKLYGPTGIGILAIKQKILKLIKPSTYGGGAYERIDEKKWKPKLDIKQFEPGTPNTAGIIGLLAAIKFFNSLKNLQSYEKELVNYAFEQLKTIKNIKLYSQKGDLNILFNLKHHHPQDVVSSLGHKNIILRSGKHCTKDFLPNFCNPSIRCSLSSYNNKQDIDNLIKALKEGGDFLEFI